MKIVRTYILLGLLFIGAFAQGQDLSLRIANKHISNDSLVFDIEGKTASGGEYIQDLMFYLNYNTDAFGTYLYTNTNISSEFLTLLSGIDGVFSNPKYTVISSTDNTSERVSITINAANSSSQGTTVFYNQFTTSYQGLMRIRIYIADATKMPEITLDENLMAIQQFYYDASSANNPFSLTVDNDCFIFPLENYDIIWNGSSWVGGTGSAGAPSSGDAALDMLIELDTTSGMPGNASVQNLVILDGSVLDLGGNTLTVTGELVGSSGAAINGTIRLAGSSAQEMVGNTQWENLEIDNSNGVSAPNGVQNISGVLTPTSGTLTTNGNILLQATDATTYGQIAPGSGTISGDVTFQMYIQQAGWHNLGSPLAGVTLADLEDDIQINYDGNSSGVSAFYWDASEGNFIPASANTESFNAGWNIYIDNNFIPDTGGVNQDGSLPVILDVVGNPNDGAKSSTIDYYSGSGAWGSYGGATDGWNLIFNPYPSNLDWSTVGPFISGDVSEFYYIWDQSLNGGDGGYVGHDGGSSDVNGGSTHIAPMQAIWVKANSSSAIGATDFDFNNSQRTTSTPSKIYKNVEHLRLQMIRSSDNFRDELLITRKPGSTLNKDNRGDAEKFVHPSSTAANFYVITPDSFSLSVSAIDASFLGDTIFLGVFADQPNSYSISIDENSFPADFKVELYDRKLGTTTDLLSNSYTFTHDPAYDEHRFDLIAVSKTIGIEEPGSGLSQTAFRVTSRDGFVTVQFQNSLSDLVDVDVVDLSGRILFSDEDVRTYTDYTFSFNTNIEQSGVYVVRVRDTETDEVFSEKIIY